MDNNETPNPTPNPTPQPAPNPASIQTPVTPTIPTSSSKKPIIILAVGLIVLALAVAGFYWYSMNQETTGEATQKTQTDTSEVIQLESDLNSITIDTLESDFTTVDKDLQSL